MNGDAEIAPPQVTTARLGTFGLAVKWLRLGLHILAGLGVLVCLPLAGSRAGRLAAWWYRRLLVVLGIAICLEGELPDRGCLAVANHVSWLDIIVLGSLLDAAFLSKSEIGGWPLVGRFARYTGTVFLTRGAGATRQVIGEMAGALRDNRSVVLFPEATTGRELAPARFHPRLFAAAVANAPNRTTQSNPLAPGRPRRRPPAAVTTAPAASWPGRAPPGSPRERVQPRRAAPGRSSEL
ncbi:MAG: 1-acyl-sn-glycerol-3-phosphate acyltransferase, partial [Salinisphaera sp.]|nr:1-acyl-sn-glycerol-3-phosphate acyltransferase [Salinisphaera sp.]